MKMPIKCTEFVPDGVEFGDRLYDKFCARKIGLHKLGIFLRHTLGYFSNQNV